MSILNQTRKDNALQVFPLIIFAAALISSNHNFTFIDDEAWILDSAVQPVRTTLALFWSGVGQHEHPPLYDILLHFWLRWTGGSFEFLRVPSIVFFLLGLYLLGRAARHLAGPSSAIAVSWAGVFWPFGFHYARLATWYSFAFFLIAGLTLAYLRYVEEQNEGRWAVFFLFGAAVLWTSYFGWALLGCLAIDQFIRHRRGERAVRPAAVAGTAVLFGVAYVPLFRAFVHEVATGVHIHQSFTALISNTAFNVYSMFVSESVAPWHWGLSIPAGLAVLACMVLVFMYAPWGSRRFLLYSALLIAVMAVTGILVTKRLFLVAPWVFLPIAVGIGTDLPRRVRFWLPLTLLLIGAIGWFGIYARQNYATARFMEPWPTVAMDAAGRIENGATVISNNPSFFLYLTYDLHDPGNGPNWKFAGLLPDTVRDPHVQSADEWLASGHPLAPIMVWVQGAADPQTQGPMEAAARLMGQSCGAQTSRMMARDPAFLWKERIFHGTSGFPWRIEVREFDCAPPSSQGTMPSP